MRIKKILASLVLGGALLGAAACGQQDGCYDDGERVSCNDDDDRDYDDDDRDYDDEDDD